MTTYLYIIVLTIMSVLACFFMRGLFLPDKRDGITDVFEGLLAVADGIALGMTVSSLGFRLFDVSHKSRAGLSHWLEYAAGFFSIYALIVGATLLVLQFPNLTAFDLCLYPFIFLSNYSLIRKMAISPGWRDD